MPELGKPSLKKLLDEYTTPVIFPGSERAAPNAIRRLKKYYTDPITKPLLTAGGLAATGAAGVRGAQEYFGED